MTKKSESKLLNELVKDCITYKLTQAVSLESYKRRKAYVRSDVSTNLWMNHFTRVGFVKSHIEHMNAINKIRDDSMQQLHKETSKANNRDERKILALKDSIMEATKLLVGLDMGSPIIAEIKAKLEQKEKQEQSLADYSAERLNKKKLS